MKNSWENVQSDYELNDNVEYFNIDEIEIFKVLYH